MFSLILFFAFSCTEKEISYNYQHINEGRWYRDSLLTFRIDSFQIETVNSYDISFELTTGHNYPYKDIWMEVSHNLRDSLFKIDSLHYLLADDYGKWLGSGAGGLNQFTLPYISAITLDTVQDYEIQIRQIMANDPLVGVEKIGLNTLVTKGK